MQYFDDNLLEFIFSLAPPDSLCSCILVQTRWYSIINNSPILWKVINEGYPWLVRPSSFIWPLNPSVPYLKKCFNARFLNESKWRKGMYTFQIASNMEVGTLLSMSAYNQVIATSYMELGIKIWQVQGKEIHLKSILYGHSSFPRALHLVEDALVSGGRDCLLVSKSAFLHLSHLLNL